MNAHGFVVFVVIVLFSAITVLNVLSWRHSGRVGRDLEACVREYRLLAKECSCPGN